MNTFDESEHPRSDDGRWEEKTHSETSISLVDPDLVDLRTVAMALALKHADRFMAETGTRRQKAEALAQDVMMRVIRAAKKSGRTHVAVGFISQATNNTVKNSLRFVDKPANGIAASILRRRIAAFEAELGRKLTRTEYEREKAAVLRLDYRAKDGRPDKDFDITPQVDSLDSLRDAGVDVEVDMPVTGSESKMVQFGLDQVQDGVALRVAKLTGCQVYMNVHQLPEINVGGMSTGAATAARKLVNESNFPQILRGFLDGDEPPAAGVMFQPWGEELSEGDKRDIASQFLRDCPRSYGVWAASVAAADRRNFDKSMAWAS